MPSRKERRWAWKRRAKSGKRAEKGHQKYDERKERVGEWREKDRNK
jgi:hypothetical protein